MDARSVPKPKTKCLICEKPIDSVTYDFSLAVEDEAVAIFVDAAVKLVGGYKHTGFGIFSVALGYFHAQ